MIDFELIWRKIHNKLSPEEEIRLQDWISESKEHKEYFDTIHRYYTDKENPLQANNENLTEFKTLRRQSFRKMKIYRLALYGSSIAATLALLLILLHKNRDIHQGEPLPEAVYTENIDKIEPGSTKAKLIMESGEVFELTEGSVLEEEIDGVRIASQGEFLSYSSQAKLAETKTLKYNTLEIPRGGEFFVILSDSTKVWINSDTKLKYPVQFLADERRVELEGEAYFEVKEDPSRPFRVISSGQVVEVLGTKFNISSYKEDPDIFTTLIEGKVKIASESSPEESLLLAPNDQGVYNKTSLEISKREVDADNFIAWKEGRFIFIEQRLDSIMFTLQRWYNIDILFMNSSLKEMRFTGNIKRYNDFEQILDLIRNTNELNYEIKGRMVYLK